MTTMLDVKIAEVRAEIRIVREILEKVCAAIGNGPTAAQFAALEERLDLVEEEVDTIVSANNLRSTER